MNTVQINRGIPGSGKSTLTNFLKELCEGKGYSMAVHSTDSLLMVDGVYTFVAEKMGYFHNLNYQYFQKSLYDWVNLIVVDNTNIMQRDFMHYVNSAKAKGYKVVEVLFHPDTLDAHVKRNTHSVPVEAVQRMYDRLMKAFDLNFADTKYEIFPTTFRKDIDSVGKSIFDNLG